MDAALPYVAVFLSGHNFEGLQELAHAVAGAVSHEERATHLDNRIRSRGVGYAEPEEVLMNPVVGKVASWRDEGKQAALATVVKVERSGPLGPGTSMAVSEDGQVVGSVSGGCVEPAVFEEAMEAIETGRPKLLTYGISDDEAFGVGLTCGGIIHIFVERVDW